MTVDNYETTKEPRISLNTFLGAYTRVWQKVYGSLPADAVRAWKSFGTLLTVPNICAPQNLNKRNAIQQLQVDLLTSTGTIQAQLEDPGNNNTNKMLIA